MRTQPEPYSLTEEQRRIFSPEYVAVSDRLTEFNREIAARYPWTEEGWGPLSEADAERYRALIDERLAISM